MDKILRFNPHFQKNYFYEETKPRKFYPIILEKLKNKFIVAIFGIRRVGKTTTLRYLMNHLITNNVPREKILYFSFDDISYSPWEVINQYEKYLGKKIDKSFYLLFDEIQKVEDYTSQLKEIYDTISPKIIISGSESAVIKKTTESLAGRIVEFEIEPLDFEEFLSFRDLNHLIGKDLDFSDYFEEYLYRQFPETVNFNLDEVKEYIESIIKKVIYQDLVSIFSIKEPDLLFKLFSFISAKPGMLVEFSSLAQELGASRNTISQYYEYLEKAFLIKKLYNYSNNIISSEKKLKKYYSYPALHYKCSQRELVIEAYISMQKGINFFHRDSRKREVDFINDEKKIIGEVKYQNVIKKEDGKNLNSLANKLKLEKKILIIKYNSKVILNDLEIKCIPPWKIQNEID